MINPGHSFEAMLQFIFLYLLRCTFTNTVHLSITINVCQGSSFVGRIKWQEMELLNTSTGLWGILLDVPIIEQTRLVYLFHPYLTRNIPLLDQLASQLLQYQWHLDFLFGMLWQPSELLGLESHPFRKPEPKIYKCVKVKYKGLNNGVQI